jgi:hypothetical protein
MNNLNSANGNIIINFNDKQFTTNIFLLNTLSKFFQVIQNGHFLEKNIINVTFLDLNDSPTKSIFFEQFLKCCYTDNFNLNIFDSLVDVIEYYRLLDYLQFVNIDKYHFVDYIHNFLNSINSCANTHDKLFSEYLDEAYKINQNCNDYSDRVTLKFVGGGWTGNLIQGDIRKPSCYRLGYDLYQTNTSITHKYTLFLLFLCDKSFHYKIIGISNIDINNIYDFDTQYHTYIFYMLATR